MFFALLLIVVGFFSSCFFFPTIIQAHIYNRNANDKRFCVCIETTICSSCCCCYYYIVVHARRTFDIHCNVCMYRIYIKNKHIQSFSTYTYISIYRIIVITNGNHALTACSPFAHTNCCCCGVNSLCNRWNGPTIFSLNLQSLWIFSQVNQIHAVHIRHIQLLFYREFSNQALKFNWPTSIAHIESEFFIFQVNICIAGVLCDL